MPSKEESSLLQQQLLQKLASQQQNMYVNMQQQNMYRSAQNCANMLQATEAPFMSALAVANVPIPKAGPTPNMRVCQYCGFSRETYDPKTNLSPERCGVCEGW